MSFVEWINGELSILAYKMNSPEIFWEPQNKARRLLQSA